MSEQRDSGAWTEYERLVLKTLERHEEEISDAHKALESLRIENALIKQQLSWRAAMFGVAGAMVPIVIAVAIALTQRWIG